MKIGDLVRCRGDEGGMFGMGVVIKEETRMVRVWWLPDSDEDPGFTIDEWNWKTSLAEVK